MSETKEITVDSLDEAQTSMLNSMREEFKNNPKWIGNVQIPEGQLAEPGTLTDADLLRFLKARKWNLEAAKKQLRDTIAWRKKNAVDYVLADPHPMALDFKKVVPTCFGLVDKFGRPVLIQRPGMIDVKLLKAHISEHTAIACHAYTQETIRRKCREQSLALGRPVNKLLSILDLTGLSLDVKEALPLVKAMAGVDERYYPETLGATLILNAPGIFTVIWGIAKTFLDADVVAKVKVCSKSESLAKLGEYFDDVSVLPVELVPNGTADLFTTADSKAMSAAMTAKETAECTPVTVPRNTIHPVELKIDATEHPQVVSWWFKANDDLKYKVDYAKDGDAKLKGVRPSTSVDPHKNPIEGEIYVSAGQSGKFTLYLNNNSLFTERRCLYYLRARPAKDYEIALRAAPTQ